MIDITHVIGRLLFGGLFVYNGINHFTNYQAMVGYSSYKKVPMASVAVAASGIWLVLSGLSVVLGIRPEIGLWMIALFLLVVTPKMHDFWTVSDPQARLGDMINFHKNMALLGAALMLLGLSRPWPFSLLP